MDRFIVFGAGAVGGVVGARLAQAGHDVALVARGAHRAAIATDGLRIEDPDASATLRLPVTDDVATLEPTPDDVVLLAVKGQHTDTAVRSLSRWAPDLPIVCLQNGTANERALLRVFDNVYAVPVMMPATHVEAGVVQATSAPTTGILDVGRYPDGLDERCHELSAAFASATFESEPRPDIMRWKWRKLVMNLGNAVEAACGRVHGNGRIIAAVTNEAEAVFEAAGIDVATAEEDTARRGDHLSIRDIDGSERAGGSSWQSLARGADSIETDLLNGEISLLGRLHGVATPVNAGLQRVARRLVLSGARPASMTPDELAAELGVS